ncbi:MAG: sulfatase-like hydrolase/transferase [Candidatus Solibacter usitatus]|nr:sulfatase-like hydrolase/transferase [Candidatus Solibacter usitatus]
MLATPISRRSLAASFAVSFAAKSQAATTPNILWITCEDTGQQLGCYGDAYAVTPSLDKLAAEGIRYRNAWSNAPVCAPARTTIISGLYPPSTGAEHMRSTTNLPATMKMYPCYLRDAGYYTTNNAKTDYNLENTGKVWDVSSNKAHWRNRKPGQPFFAVFNILTTHESQVIKRPHTLVHDPAKARVPAYHPDAPEVRRDWAQYYDNITTMDGQAADILRQLEQDGLASDTIVFFYGDHGAGMPRSKRFPYDSGLRVPLLVRIPEKFRNLAPQGHRPGMVSDRMVAFVDLAPTLLSLAGVKAPAHMQGSAFLGTHAGPARLYNYGFRGRMDERYDLMRSVTDGRYVYIRNYMPHRIYGQFVGTMFQTPTTQVWKKRYDSGQLNAAQKHFWETKPPEELYDLQTDRDEVNNLAGSPAHRQTLERMRKANREHLLRIRDVGFLPEGEIHTRAKGLSPYEVGHDDERYPMERVLTTAELASSLDTTALPRLVRALDDPDSAVRYWAASGILMRGGPAVLNAVSALRARLEDSGPYVRAVAAEALARFGSEDDVRKSLSVLLDLVPAPKNGAYVSLWALIVIDDLGPKAAPILDAVKACNVEDENSATRARAYPGRVMAKLKGTPRR